MKDSMEMIKVEFASFLEQLGLKSIRQYLSVIEWKMCRDEYNTYNITKYKNLFFYTNPYEFDDIKSKLLNNPLFIKDVNDKSKGNFGDHKGAMKRYSEFLHQRYQCIQDKTILTPDIENMVFVGLTEMQNYCGPEDELTGGGEYVNANGYGHELFNFKYDDGYCYGYTPPYGKLTLNRISDEIKEDSFGQYVDNVLIVFTGTRPSKGRIIVGWYKNARVYANIVNDNRTSRFFEKIDTYIGYNIVCLAKNVTRIDYDDRSILIPLSKMNAGIGHGQHNVWYADEDKDELFKDKIITYINQFETLSTQNSETKYHLYDESKKTIVTSTNITRSQKARKLCIEIHGCFCNICGFNFESNYGDIGKDYIEVHHVTPIGDLSNAEDYEGTDPEHDLIPLCSNCHAMIHRKKIPYTPEEIRNKFGK